MNTRAMFWTAMLVVAVQTAVCGKQDAAAADTKATGSASDTRDESRVNAGGVPPAPITGPVAPAGHPGNPKAGEGLFGSMNCDGCHGGGATGWEGPSLVDGRWRYGGSDEELFQSIYYGRPKGMPAYGGVLGVDGVWTIVSYLRSQPVPSVVPTTNYEEPEPPAASLPPSTEPAANKASASDEPGAAGQQASDPRALLAQYGCVGCHAIDKKVVGPAFRDVAAKYRSQAGAAQHLEGKIKNGSVGTWGTIPMPPNSGVTDADLHKLVNWIMTSPDVRG